jgi:hypothetical protein
MNSRMRLCLLLCACAALLPAAELAGVRSVYFLPMARGLDQYLANRMAGERLFQVVTDPKVADAVFTDRIGEGFQAQMETMLPLPPPTTSQPAKKDEDKPDASSSPLPTDTVNKLSNPAMNSSFGRARGTIFLVDVKSHQVLWSTYDPPRSSSPKDLDRTASDIVSRLKRALHPKEK